MMIMLALGYVTIFLPTSFVREGLVY